MGNHEELFSVTTALNSFNQSSNSDNPEFTKNNVSFPNIDQSIDISDDKKRVENMAGCKGKSFIRRRP